MYNTDLLVVAAVGSRMGGLQRGEHHNFVEGAEGGHFLVLQNEGEERERDRLSKSKIVCKLRREDLLCSVYSLQHHQQPYQSADNGINHSFCNHL